MTELEKSNELIEMLKMDRGYYEESKRLAIANDSGWGSITRYSTIVIYIDSLIARVNNLIKEA